MHLNITPNEGQGASLSRRNFLAVAAAGTAVTMPYMADTTVSDETVRQVPPLDVQLDACVAQLKTILMQMHPQATEVGKVDPTRISNPDGSFFFVMSGRIPPQPFQGDGYYMVSMDGYPQLFRLEHRHTYGLSTGKILPGQDYFLATAIHEDGYVDQPRRMGSPRILRKVEGGLEL